MSSEFQVRGTRQAESPNVAPRPDQVSCVPVSCAPVSRALAPESLELRDELHGVTSGCPRLRSSDQTPGVGVTAGEQQLTGTPATGQPNGRRARKLLTILGTGIRRPPSPQKGSRKASSAAEEHNATAEPVCLLGEVVPALTGRRRGRSLSPAPSDPAKRSFTPRAASVAVGHPGAAAVFLPGTSPR